MTDTPLRMEDRAQIVAHGLTVEDVLRQIELFKHPPRHVKLERLCLPGCGIRVLGEDQVQTCLAVFEEACVQGRFLKFTPASGAASRMFKSLLAVYEHGGDVSRAQQARRAKNGDAVARDVLVWMDGLTRFAFYDDLKAVMQRDGLAIGACIERDDYRPIFEYLLTDRGLDYAALPKGLLKFHRYPSGNRTAFEEHLVEAAVYVRDSNGVCRLHFTVSPQHLERFEQLLETVRAAYEARYAAHFQVSFSTQHPSTDTVAVDLNDHLFRDATGQLLFRPGGHGALIENLNDLRGDVVFIKNIDNVVPDDRKGPPLHWAKVLGGYLVHLQSEIFRHLAALNNAASPPTAICEALHFAREVLSTEVPTQAVGASGNALRDFLVAKLDRPLRVCGMVRSESNPGGGPFWVKGGDGTSTLQIVETAQVDPDAPDQQALLRATSHFNPVNLVCGVRNWRGEPFDLRKYIDPSAVFISQKSSGGKALKALEHPGLWNGAMADWNTLFVEVPAETFRPVKTINDLLD
jgi:hypothetical protein